MTIEENTGSRTKIEETPLFDTLLRFSANGKSLKLTWNKGELTLTPEDAVRLAAVLDGYVKLAPNLQSVESLWFFLALPSTR